MHGVRLGLSSFLRLLLPIWRLPMQDPFPLLSRDGVAVSALRQIHAASHGDPRYVDAVLSALRQLDPGKSHRAGWLLVAAAREGLVQPNHLPRLAAIADEATDWATRAYLVHVFALIDVPESLRPAVLPFLEECAADRHGILRVWALTAVLRWKGDARYADFTKELIVQSKADPQKAVQARLRQLGLIPYPPRRQKKRPRHAMLVGKSDRHGVGAPRRGTDSGNRGSMESYARE
jgi:hypothetical protein